MNESSAEIVDDAQISERRRQLVETVARIIHQTVTGKR